ncbi:MAG: tRNA pseudouridine(55) synthase TruB [Lachnospiraceae bacterium]|nr:tRNA pseudouridine(55) synthase TruB [Lachnospiraceae bacterium]
MNGIINVYKEPGYTSFDVVARLRGILHQRKIGHTGTLDPDAEGVLPVCLGRATKVCELLTGRDKTYRAVCRLGVETDTQDLSGTVLQHYDFSQITAEQLNSVVESFQGDSMQIPPMYSALKINGKRLYELAREGKTVERKPRPIHISQLRLGEIDLENGIFCMEVTCSKGTYIRTLCHDIGKKLGIGAAMEQLTRTRVDVFRVEDAMKLSEIEQLAADSQEALAAKIWQVDSLFPNVTKAKIVPEAKRLLENGNQLPADGLVGKDGASLKKREQEQVLVYDSLGNFCAIYTYTGKSYKCTKMF